MATYAGIRPVVGTGKVDPSKESREHILWQERGLLTVTGGKLTTFRLMAIDALAAIFKYLPRKIDFNPNQRVLNPPLSEEVISAQLDPASRLRILGRYGMDAPRVIDIAEDGELDHIENSVVLWSELRWAARAEGVIHLDDLLLRRVRLGLLLPNGGLCLIEKIRTMVQSELDWDDTRWKNELDRYKRIVQTSLRNQT